MKLKKSTRKREEAHDRAKLPNQKPNQANTEEILEDKRKLAKLNQRRMTYFDGNLMAAIMDMDLNDNLAQRDTLHLVKTKTKGTFHHNLSIFTTV